MTILLTDDIINAFAGLVRVPAVDNLLITGGVEVPSRGNYLEEPVPGAEYWERVVLFQRENGETRQYRDGVMPYWVQARVDIMPPEDPAYNPQRRSDLIHGQIKAAVNLKRVALEASSQVSSFQLYSWRLKLVRTTHGYLTSHAIYKTIIRDKP